MKTRIILILAILVLIVGGVTFYNLYIDEHQISKENLNTKVYSSAKTNDDFTNTSSSSASEIVTINEEEISKKTNSYDEKEFEYSEETLISLNGDSISVDGSNVKVDNNTIYIVGAGAYRITGTLNDGRIIVNAPSENVKIILDNASITCSYSSPIYVYKSKNTMIYLNNESTNYLEDGTKYSYNDEYSSEEDEEPNATLYSKSDLIICGNGTLNIKANNNAITSKDTLIIEKATLNVDATNHGINGKDNNTINNAILNITSGGDAIRSTNDTDTSLGWIRIENSTLKINSKEDAIQGQTDVIIDGSTLEVVSSSKGIKADSNIVLNGDTKLAINSEDDAIHAGGSVEINGGNYTINSSDDGIHADKTLTINDGNIVIEKSYEGLEAENVVINGGNVDVTSEDDGININGGNDGSGFGRMGDFGGKRNMTPPDMNNPMENNSSTSKLIINGGNIIVNSNGDGLDSNGSIEMNGGNVLVQGPTSSANGALDYNTSFYLNGGTLIAIGSSGMAQGVKTNETQGSVTISLNNQQTKGTQIELKDSNGKLVLEATSEKAFNYLVLTSADVKTDEEYSIYLNGELASKVTATSDSSSSGFGGFAGGFKGGRR